MGYLWHTYRANLYTYVRTSFRIDSTVSNTRNTEHQTDMGAHRQGPRSDQHGPSDRQVPSDPHGPLIPRGLLKQTCPSLTNMDPSSDRQGGTPSLRQTGPLLQTERGEAPLHRQSSSDRHGSLRPTVVPIQIDRGPLTSSGREGHSQTVVENLSVGWAMVLSNNEVRFSHRGAFSQ